MNVDSEEFKENKKMQENSSLKENDYIFIICKWHWNGIIKPEPFINKIENINNLKCILCENIPKKCYSLCKNCLNFEKKTVYTCIHCDKRTHFKGYSIQCETCKEKYVYSDKEQQKFKCSKCFSKLDLLSKKPIYYCQHCWLEVKTNKQELFVYSYCHNGTYLNDVKICSKCKCERNREPLVNDLWDIKYYRLNDCGHINYAGSYRFLCSCCQKKVCGDCYDFCEECCQLVCKICLLNNLGEISDHCKQCQ